MTERYSIETTKINYFDKHIGEEINKKLYTVYEETKDYCSMITSTILGFIISSILIANAITDFQLVPENKIVPTTLIISIIISSLILIMFINKRTQYSLYCTHNINKAKNYIKYLKKKQVRK